MYYKNNKIEAQLKKINIYNFKNYTMSKLRYIYQCNKANDYTDLIQTVNIKIRNKIKSLVDKNETNKIFENTTKFIFAPIEIYLIFGLLCVVLF